MVFSMIDCIQSYFLHCKFEKNLSPKSIKAYQIDLRQFSSYVERTQNVSGIDRIDKTILKEYIRSISTHNKPKTIKRKIASVKVFFNYLEFEDMIPVNPFRKIRLKINEGKRLPRIIPLPKIVSLFQHIYYLKDQMQNKLRYSYKALARDIAVLELLFSTGVRVAELCNLKRRDVDLYKGSIRVIGKGNKERIIPLCNEEPIAALKEYSETHRPNDDDIGYFFTNRHARRLSEQSVRFMIKKYLKALKINDNVTPHMFRHSIATLLLEGGVDIRYIQNLLGHSSITTTQLYVQVNQEAQRKILVDKHPRQFL